MNFNSPHSLQGLLPLTQTIVIERGHSLVCLPDRDTAQCELAKLRREYRKRLVRAAIRKDKPGKSSTYTLKYFTRDVQAVALF